MENPPAAHPLSAPNTSTDTGTSVGNSASAQLVLHSGEGTLHPLEELAVRGLLETRTVLNPRQMMRLWSHQ